MAWYSSLPWLRFMMFRNTAYSWKCMNLKKKKLKVSSDQNELLNLRRTISEGRTLLFLVFICFLDIAKVYYLCSARALGSAISCFRPGQRFRPRGPRCHRRPRRQEAAPGVALACSAYSVNDRSAAPVSTSHPGPSGRFSVRASFGGTTQREEKQGEYERRKATA